MNVKHNPHSTSLLGKLKWFWSHTSILLLLLLCSVGLNVLLAQRTKLLNIELERRHSQLENKSLKTGSLAPPLSALDSEGRPVSISFSQTGLPTVLYVFTPDCRWCARNNANLTFLVNNLGTKFRFIGISLKKDQLADYLIKNNVTFPVYNEVPDSVRLTYGLGATPQTIVVSTDGRVLRNWIGAYKGDMQSDVEGFFQLQLPGLTDL
jgi:peroxiredoxin